jgi:hypothetical protein
MSDPQGFMNSYAQAILALVNNLYLLQRMNQQLADDPTLSTNYFALPANNRRTDIVAADVTNAAAAIVQLLFTYNSGTPTQAQYLLKMMP